MDKKIDDRLIIKICELYYNNNLSQTEIAKSLGISRPLVAKALSSAREKKITEIKINDLKIVKFWDLEEKLKERFGLKYAIVVDGKDKSVVKREAGLAARRFLDSKIKSGYTVGVSMGSSLCAMLDYGENHDIENLKFIPLIGGMGKLKTELHSNHIAENLAKEYNGQFFPLYAPARLSSVSLINRLKKEIGVAGVIKSYKDVDMAFVGIGYPNENSSIKATGYYKENEISTLIKREVVGEICMQFYNSDGKTDNYNDVNHVIGIELKKLKNIPLCVGIAVGKEKTAAVSGAIKGGYINVLITDSDCAENLLNLRILYERNS